MFSMPEPGVYMLQMGGSISGANVVAKMVNDDVEAEVVTLEGTKDTVFRCRSTIFTVEDDDHEASRFITDPIHGEIEVPVVCQAFLHSLEFDRLRSVRQLGCSHYVFPGAKHSRMEHSLGVMHLAGEMMDHLMKKRPGCADETDKICVMMAGLCHDLGHGPFR